MDRKMKALHHPIQIRAPALHVDFVADLTCPWSFLGKRRLERALEHVQGLAPQLRWHAFLMHPEPAAGASWRERLAERLPNEITPEAAEANLIDSGKELGVRFDFARLGAVPHTGEAHRLIKLAARRGLHMETGDAVFRAWFELGRDIGQTPVLAQIGAEVGLPAALLDAFRASDDGRAEVGRDHDRLHALGIVSVPNLLLNGSVLVTGPADVATYVKALDHALFPSAEDEETSGAVATLH
jgi:predicted DsbA family dithiol-disulfide isomerase